MKRFSVLLLSFITVGLLGATDAAVSPARAALVARARSAVATLSVEGALLLSGDVSVDHLTEADADWQEMFPAAESPAAFYASPEGKITRAANPLARLSCYGRLWFTAFAYLPEDVAEIAACQNTIEASLMKYMAAMEVGDLPRNRLARWLTSMHVLAMAHKAGFEDTFRLDDRSPELEALDQGMYELIAEVDGCPQLVALPSVKKQIKNALVEIAAS